MNEIRLSPQAVRDFLGRDIGFARAKGQSLLDDKKRLIQGASELGLPSWVGEIPASHVQAEKSGAVTIYPLDASPHIST